MIGGIFEGSNGDPFNGPYTVLATIATSPPAGWNELPVSLTGYRYLRYLGAANSFCNVAELEFYRAGVKLTGQTFGTAGSWANAGSTYRQAFDGDVATFFDAPTSDPSFADLDPGASSGP